MEDRRRVQVRLSKPEQRQLERLLSGGLQPVRTVLRALVLRQLADGQAIRTVARSLFPSGNTPTAASPICTKYPRTSIYGIAKLEGL